MTLLFDSALKISVVLALSLLAATLLGNRSAAVRHWVLSAGVLCAAVLPFASLVLPAWNVSPAISRAIPLPVSYTLPSDASPAFAVNSEVPGFFASLSAAEFFGMVWLAGCGVALMILAIGFFRLARVAAKATDVTDGAWAQLVGEISLAYGLRRRVRLQQSESPAMLITWGTLRPQILLPQGVESWPEERIRVVLHHELAHVRRNDWLLHTLAEVLRAVYWFNPLMWVVCRRLRLESEYAADDAVLSRGFSGPRYAAHLLEIVRILQQPDRAWSAASAMARPSTLERRFSAMLKLSVDRRPPGRLAIAAVSILFLGASLSLAALRSPAAVPVVVAEVIPVALPAATPLVPPAVPKPAPKPSQAPAVAQTYKGEIISLDLKDVDFKDLFRLIADISGLNIVLDPAVTGSVTIQLKEIPWDQVLDIVMRNYNLMASVQGNVMRISAGPAGIPQGRIVLDFAVLRNGQQLGQPRIGTIDKIGATLSFGADFTISATPTRVAGGKVELSFEFVIGTEKFAGSGLAVAPGAPGKVMWESGGNSFEVRITLVAAP